MLQRRELVKSPDPQWVPANRVYIRSLHSLTLLDGRCAALTVDRAGAFGVGEPVAGVAGDEG
jgi:hypothetical protein